MFNKKNSLEIKAFESETNKEISLYFIKINFSLQIKLKH